MYPFSCFLQVILASGVVSQGGQLSNSLRSQGGWVRAWLLWVLELSRDGQLQTVEVKAGWFLLAGYLSTLSGLSLRLGSAAAEKHSLSDCHLCSGCHARVGCTMLYEGCFMKIKHSSWRGGCATAMLQLSGAQYRPQWS